MKVVINKCYGGFGLSHEAVLRLGQLRGVNLYPQHDARFSSMDVYTYWKVPPEERPAEIDWKTASLEARQAHNEEWSTKTFSEDKMDRHDPMLVQVVEELGEKANGSHAKLSVVEIPDGIDYEIDEYDGYEHIAERHRTWS